MAPSRRQPAGQRSGRLLRLDLQTGKREVLLDGLTRPVSVLVFDRQLIVVSDLEEISISLTIGSYCRIFSVRDSNTLAARSRVSAMGFKQRYFVEPDAKLKLSRFDPADTGKYKDNDGAAAETKGHIARLHKLQYKLYAENQRSMLVVLQGLDAAGKDGTIRHVISGINPQGVKVADFKEPTPIELAHDFLWRVHPHEPAKGQITIFNRSHYEDVLVVRVHKLVPKSVWSKRYARIRQFEELMGESGVKVVKFFLHISPEEQLRRFGDRLNDPDRNWKISESDYTERELWEEYTEAFQDALRLTSTREAPWFIVPSDRKWFRDLVIAKILADTLDDMNIKIPAPTVDLDAIRRKYHAAAKEQRKDDRKDLVPGEMKAAEAGAER